MIVCEYEFERPDPKNPSYSLVEVDIYGFIMNGLELSQSSRLVGMGHQISAHYASSGVPS